VRFSKVLASLVLPFRVTLHAACIDPFDAGPGRYTATVFTGIVAEIRAERVRA